MPRNPKPTDDEISDDLLANVPELDAQGDAADVPFTLVRDDAPAPPAFRPVPYPLGGEGAAPLHAPATSPTDVPRLVAAARERLTASMEAQLSRVESSFGALLSEMEARLAQAELELAAVRAEHARVKDETDRKGEALRALKKALENI